MKLKILFFPLSMMLAVIIFIWMIKPEWDETSKARANYQQSQKDMQQLTDNINKLEQVVADYESLGTERKLVENAVPYEPKRDELIAQTYEKARDAEVFIGKITIGKGSKNSECKEAEKGALAADLAGISEKGSTKKEPNTTDRFTPICLLSETVKVEVSGDYLKVKKFVTLLEQMNRLASISKVQIDKQVAKEGELSGGLKATVDFTVYYKNKLSTVDPQRMVNKEDPVGKQLISGSLDQRAIQSFQDLVSTRPADPITVTSTGKDDIFN